MKTPTEVQLLQWKHKYGAVHIATVEDTRVYYRSLTTQEYMSFLELSNSLSNKDWAKAICDITVLFPTELEFNMAGSYSTIATTVAERTGLSESDFDIATAEARAWAKANSDKAVTYALAIKTCVIFPGLDLLQLLKLTPEQLFRISAVLELATNRPILTEEQQLNVESITVDQETLKKRGVTPESIGAATSALGEQIKRERSEANG